MSYPGLATPFEVGGRIEFDGEGSPYAILNVTDTHVELDGGYAQLQYTRAYLDALILQNQAYYRSPAFLAAAGHHDGFVQTLSSWEEGIAKVSTGAPKKAEAKPTLPKVFCWLCEREIKGAVIATYYGDSFRLDARCCGRSETKTWSKEFVEKLVGSGGKFSVFIS